LRLSGLIDGSGDDNGLNTASRGSGTVESKLLSGESTVVEEDLKDGDDVALDALLDNGSLRNDVLTANDAGNRLSLDLRRRSQSAYFVSVSTVQQRRAGGRGQRTRTSQSRGRALVRLPVSPICFPDYQEGYRASDLRQRFPVHRAWATTCLRSKPSRKEESRSSVGGEEGKEGERSVLTTGKRRESKTHSCINPHRSRTTSAPHTPTPRQARRTSRPHHRASCAVPQCRTQHPSRRRNS
jgi:hypothetical protein